MVIFLKKSLWKRVEKRFVRLYRKRLKMLLKKNPLTSRLMNLLKSPKLKVRNLQILMNIRTKVHPKIRNLT